MSQSKQTNASFILCAILLSEKMYGYYNGKVKFAADVNRATAPCYLCGVSQWRIAVSTLLRFPKLLSAKQMQTWITAQRSSRMRLWKEEKQYCQVPLYKAEVMWTDLREYSEAKNQQPQRLSVFLCRLRLRWLISVFVIVNVTQKIKARKKN